MPGTEAWKILRLGGFRAIVLLSLFTKWYTTVLVDLLHEERESIEWKSLHVGAERGVNCEHVQALLTYTLQRHWEWQEDRWTDLEPGFYRYSTAFMASWDVKAAFDQALSGIEDSLPDRSPWTRGGGSAG